MMGVSVSTILFPRTDHEHSFVNGRRYGTKRGGNRVSISAISSCFFMVLGVLDVFDVLEEEDPKEQADKAEYNAPNSFFFMDCNVVLSGNVFVYIWIWFPASSYNFTDFACVLQKYRGG